MFNVWQYLYLGQTAPEGGMGSGLMLLVWVAIFGFFYLIFIRPQQKRQKEHKQLIEELKAGDRVITIGGFKGVITKVKDDSFMMKVAPEMEVEVIKSAVGRRETVQGSEEKKNS